MKKTGAYILFLMFFVLHFCQAQNEASFHTLFQELEFEVLPVYSHSRHPDDYLATSTYLFKGQEIDSVYYPIFRHLLEGEEWSESVCYASHNFYINYNIEAFLIRESKWDGTEHHIHCLLYNHPKGQFVQSNLLSFAYGYEGSFGAMESWILDVNKDGQKDIINRTWTETYIGEDAHYIYHDSIQLSIFEKDSFIEIPLKDTILQNQLKEDFPFHTESSLGYDSGKKLKEVINIKQDEQIWCIIAGSDKDLEAALYEKNRAMQIIGYNYKYGLDIRHFNIYYDKNKNRYYSMIKGFGNENEARIALKEIKKIFNKTAFVVSFADWCPNMEWNKAGYYHCVDNK